MVKSSHKAILYIIAKFSAAWFSIVLYITFVLAYINPLKIVKVSINSVGEAHIELIALTFVLPLIIYFTYIDIRDRIKIRRIHEKERMQKARLGRDSIRHEVQEMRSRSVLDKTSKQK